MIDLSEVAKELLIDTKQLNKLVAERNRLLNACRELVHSVENYEDLDKAYHMAKDAIAISENNK